MEPAPVSGGGELQLALLTPHDWNQPVEIERLQCLRMRLAGLSVITDVPVPDVHHLVPLLHDRLALSRTVDGGGAVALRWTLDGGRDPTAKRHHPVDGGRSPPEVD